MIIFCSFFHSNILNVQKKIAFYRRNTTLLLFWGESTTLGMHVQMSTCHEALILYSFSAHDEHAGKQDSYLIIR